MIKMPYAQLLEKITSTTELSPSEVEDRVRKKLDQLAGLISKEGAAHIVANELGVKLFETGKIKVKDILPGMRSVETVGKVTQVYEVREFVTNGREGRVGSFIMGDSSGVIRVVLWGEQSDMLSKLSEGTVVRIKDAYVKENMNSRPELHLSTTSSLFLNPEGLQVESIDTTPTRRKISELSEADSNVELLGTIVQVFEPRFFEVCPTCSRRVRDSTGSFACQAHGAVEPAYSFVLNVFLDDGFDNIRAVFFQKSAIELVRRNYEDMLSLRDAPAGFDAVKNELLGNMVLLSGRVAKNAMFDRLEFIANTVSHDVDPDAEVKKLDEELRKAQTPNESIQERE